MQSLLVYVHQFLRYIIHPYFFLTLPVMNDHLFLESLPPSQRSQAAKID